MPANSKVGRLVRKLQSLGKSKVSAIKIAQSAIGQSYKTGRKAKGKRK